MTFPLTGQTGDYFITNYPSNVYKGAVQNFDIVQDDFGLLYFANNTCILEYNGKNWQTIHLREFKTPTSFAKGMNNMIYVGGENEIGFLQRDARGKTNYHSLVDQLSEEERKFTSIWNTLVIGEDIFYCANEIIIRYRNGKITSWKPGSSFHKAHVLNGKLFVREVDRGILYLDGDEFKKVKGSDEFASSDFKIAFFLPRGDNEFLIFTRTKGVYRFTMDVNDPGNSLIQKYGTTAFLDALLKFEPYDLISSDEKHIIGTIDHGIFVFDKDLNLEQNISTASGLQNDECRKLFTDAQKNLWVAFNNGLSRIEINSPLKKWDKYNKIEGSVTSFVKYKGEKYIATSKGLMVYEAASGIFKYVNEIGERCLDLAVIDDYLYIATEQGVYGYNGSVFNLIYSESAVNTVKSHKSHKDVIFCGTDNGVAIINAVSHTFVNEIASPLNSPVLHIAILDENRILASTRSEGLFYYDLISAKTEKLPENNKFYQTTTDNYLFDHDEKVYIGTDSGFYSIDSQLKFSEVKELNQFIKGKYSVSTAAFSGNDLFLSLSNLSSRELGKEENAAYTKSGAGLIPAHMSLSKTGEIGVRQFYFDSSYVYMSKDEGVYILNRSARLEEYELRPYLSKVIRNSDTVLFNLQKSIDSLEFAFGKNEFVFEFGSNDFSDESKLMFQFYLEGLQSNYGDWTETFRAAYDNIELREGNYVFHLKARNIYGKASEELVMRFTILAPWYRTQTAYAIYSLLAIGFIILIIKLNAKRLVEQNKRLERIIDDRTQTITHQKTEIEQKNKEITDSISYAQKIQLALMASLRLLDKNLRGPKTESVSPLDYFLLYQPKDIVSGDFYWATELKDGNANRFLVLAADCTGHGVPGAFMSLLCIGFLNEITREKQISEPGKIFDELRSRLVSTLNPDGSETERKDGMDAVMLCLGGDSGKLNYAAANNSFYVIRNNELIHLRADKMPVGKHEVIAPFKTQVFDLQKGDVVYAFTDGYADQFGGPKGKKFKYKQLEKLFLEIHQMDGASQKEILIDRFHAWKGSHEQVDDVLVLGIRF
jgi:serine phosphatase RsbU (regulator of sigma subunit)